MRIFVVLVTATLLVLSSLPAEAAAVDAPPTVRSVGSAARSVPLDTLRIVFGLKTTARSFGAARDAASAVFDGIRERVRALDTPEPTFRHEIASLGQDRISFGNRGKDVAHQLIIEIERLDSTRLNDIVVQIVDGGLELDNQLVVLRLDAYLSPKSERELYDQLLAEAARDALSQAQRVASEVGASIGAPRTLSWSRDVASGQPYEEITVTASKISGYGYVSVNEPFSLTQPLPTVTERRVGVEATFTLAPAVQTGATPGQAGPRSPGR